MTVFAESDHPPEAVMKMDLKLNIFTLNCWGIVGVSRHRKERMAAVASHIAASSYDFVFLQEVWSREDFQMICRKTASVLPYSHYFYSGVIGSGVCILSTSRIIETSQFPYSLNGFAHKVLHGDWFGGKVVGLCKVIHHGLKINLYVTHLHAEYNHMHDQYLSHRIVQSFEFSQFVKLTSESADFSIISGDFNTEKGDLPYQMIVHNIGCTDSFLTTHKFKETSIVSTTCGHPDNMYTSKQELRECPTGKRIDYIMYKCNSGMSVKCLSCETPLSKIPGTTIPYSDHEAVVAQFHVFKSAQEPIEEVKVQSKMSAINGCLDVLTKSLRDLQTNRLIYLLISILLIIVLTLTIIVDMPGAYDILLEIVQVITTVALAFCIWMATVMNRLEHNALLSSWKSMEVLINSMIVDHGFNLPIKPVDVMIENTVECTL